MLLLSIALEILPLAAATRQTGPYFESQRVLLQWVERGKEWCKAKCTSAIHESNVRRHLPTRSPASPRSSQQCWCAMQRVGVCTTPQRHAFLNCRHMYAPSPAPFPRPQCSGGNSCRMLPVIHLILSSLNSIILGITKPSNDLLIKNCFHGAPHHLQWVFSCLVNTWIVFLAEVSQHHGKWQWVSPRLCVTTEALTQFQPVFSHPDL